MSVMPLSSVPGCPAAAHAAEPPGCILPVAPQAVCRLRYARENQTRQALNPSEVIAEIDRSPGLTRVELDGPGDPLAARGH